MASSDDIGRAARQAAELKRILSGHALSLRPSDLVVPPAAFLTPPAGFLPHPSALSSAMARADLVSSIDSSWMDEILRRQRTDIVSLPLPVLETVRGELLQSLAEMSRLANSALAVIDWRGGILATAAPSRTQRLRGTTNRLARAYDRLVAPAASAPAGLLSLPMVVAEGATTALFTYADALTVVTSTETTKGGPERAEARDAARESLEDAVRPLLAPLGLHLLQMWEGARQSIASDNPDAARHAMISLRSLMEELFRLLSPRDAVSAWTSNPDDFLPSGEPKHATNVRYICRGFNTPEMAGFLDHQVRTVVAFFQLLSRVHKAKLELNSAGRSMLLLTGESTIRLLVEAARYGT